VSSASLSTGRSARRPARLLQRANLPLLGVVLLAALLLGVSAVGNRPREPLPFDPDSTADDGLAALNLWLRALGYDVKRTGPVQFALPPDAGLVFVYPNQLTYTQAEAAALRAWVEAGGTLVLVGPDGQDGALEEAFGVRSGPRENFALADKQVQPLLPDGLREYWADWSVQDAVLDLQDAPAAVVLLRTAAGEPAVAVQSLGAGVAWHLAPSNALTNRGLAQNDHGHLLPALLRSVPPGGVVVFDTFHQFGSIRMGERILTLQDWVYRTPGGWGVLFAVLASGLFLLLQGRRLGPPVVTLAERRRREAAEYVEAMALLSQRAGLRADVAAHQRRRLKRGLARRRPLDPELEDALFVQRLAASEPPLEPEHLAEVVQTLRALAANPSAAQLATLAAGVDRLIAVR